MVHSSSGKQHGIIERFAYLVTQAAGSTAAFITALILILIWVSAGSALHYSSNWLWLISISTSTITFLMVFLIQKAQNKDSLAIQLKLNELLAAHEKASNKMVNVENMPEEELKIIQKYYSELNKNEPPDQFNGSGSEDGVNKNE